MWDYIIRGGRKLEGTVVMPAAKNSVLPILAACMLSQSPCSVFRVPNLSDVTAACSILKEQGCLVKRENDRIRVTADRCSGREISKTYMRAMRSSLFFLAPILCRTGKASISAPGGCDLGSRPIDIHLDGLSAMGTQIEQDENGVVTCRATHGLHGTDYTLRLPSVGATETLLMAASTAKGTSVIRGGAREPEVVDLADFLNACGARIRGAGTGCITVEGVACLHGCSYTPVTDRIVAATVLCGVAAAGGSVVLRGAERYQLGTLLSCLEKAGVMIRETERGLAADCRQGLQGEFFLETGPYPAFATDAAPLLAAAFLKGRGSCTITDQIFSHRFACAEGFRALGAKTVTRNNKITVWGSSGLHGADLKATDLRGGAALTIAALAAEGESRLAGTAFIHRGYENLAALFGTLGADIQEIHKNTRQL